MSRLWWSFFPIWKFGAQVLFSRHDARRKGKFLRKTKRSLLQSPREGDIDNNKKRIILWKSIAQIPRIIPQRPCIIIHTLYFYTKYFNNIVLLVRKDRLRFWTDRCDIRKSFKIFSDDRLERSNSDDWIVLDQFVNKLATCLGMSTVRLLLSSI